MSWRPSNRSRPQSRAAACASRPRAGAQPASGGRDRRRGQRWRRWPIFSVQRAGRRHRGPDRRERTGRCADAVVAQTSDEAELHRADHTSQPAFVPATRLTNYVVAHSEYSSPLAPPLGPERRARGRRWRPGRRDATDATSPSRRPAGRRRSSRSLNNASMAVLQILRRPGRRRAHGDEPGARRATAKRASGSSACPNRSPPATTKAAIFHVRNSRSETMRIIHRVEKGKVTERLVSLDGSGREIIRNQNEVICYLPDRRTVLVEKRTDDRTLMADGADLQRTARSALQHRARRFHEGARPAHAGDPGAAARPVPLRLPAVARRRDGDAADVAAVRSQRQRHRADRVRRTEFPRPHSRRRREAGGLRRRLPLGAAGRAGAAHGERRRSGWNVHPPAGRIPPDDAGACRSIAGSNAPVRHLVLFGRARVRVGVHRAAHRRRPKRCAGWPRSAPRSPTRATWTVTRSPLSAKCRRRRSRRSPQA